MTHTLTYPVQVADLPALASRDPETLADHQVIARIRAAHPDDYRILIARYQRQVFGLLARMGFDRDAAEDLAQESFIRAYHALPTFRGESQFATWLYRIVYRQALQQIRTQERQRRIRHEVLQPLTELNRPEPTHRRTELRRALDTSLRQLPANQRLALALYYFHEQSYEEVAQSMGVPLNTVKTHIRRGKLRLRELFVGVEIP